MLMILENGQCFELSQNVIVGGPDRDLFGAIVRNPSKGNAPRLTVIGGDEVTLSSKIREVSCPSSSC